MILAEGNMTHYFEIEIYQTSLGKEPFNQWLEGLDKGALARIDARLTRIERNGNFGDCEPVGEGVFEIKFDFGPGYRIYFGYKTNTNLILLLGGYKKGQQKNIDKAKEYWHEYLSQRKGKNAKT